MSTTDIEHRPRALVELLADHRVKEIDDERGYGNGYFVYLNPGFAFGYGGAHCFAEDTLRDVKRSLHGVVTCNCDDCRKGLGW